MDDYFTMYYVNVYPYIVLCTSRPR